MYIENRKRSVLKAFSWRILATLTTALIVYIFTGEILLAISVGGIEFFVKMAIYFVHERVWNKVSYGKRTVEPFVLWFTGLSGAGKSTLAKKTFDYLEQKGLKVEELDGDVVRSIFPQTGFTKEDRDRHVKRVGFLASILEKNGVIVVSSFISPYKDARNFVRGLCKNFVEIHVDASVEVCEQRDVKGLYKKARAGEIANFTGVNDPYEIPESAEIVTNTGEQSVDESFEVIKNKIDVLVG